MPLVAVLALRWACCSSGRCSCPARCIIGAGPGLCQEGWVALHCCIRTQLQCPAVEGVFAALHVLWITAGLCICIVAKCDVQCVTNEAESVSSAAWAGTDSMCMYTSSESPPGKTSLGLMPVSTLHCRTAKSKKQSAPTQLTHAAGTGLSSSLTIRHGCSWGWAVTAAPQQLPVRQYHQCVQVLGLLLGCPAAGCEDYSGQTRNSW
jgi:hypothetical protein